MTTQPVIVGIDGTDAGRPAVAWAAQAAHDRGAPLLVVHAAGDDPDDTLDDRTPAAVAGQDAVVRAGFWAAATLPFIDVRLCVLPGAPETVLAGLSHEAALVVVGMRRLPRVERVFAPSLADHLAASAACPVAVVPADVAIGSDVVVAGVDGRRTCDELVGVAAREADRLACELLVVHALEPGHHVNLGVLDLVAGTDRQTGERILAEAVAGTAERYPHLVVRRTVVGNPPSDALLAAARDARLLVVGSTRRHGPSRLLLGSVGSTVVTAARCPVLVVPTSQVDGPALRHRSA